LEEIKANLIIYEAIRIMADGFFDFGVENEALRDKLSEI
jgi:hypothetical protein